MTPIKHWNIEPFRFICLGGVPHKQINKQIENYRKIGLYYLGDRGRIRKQDSTNVNTNSMTLYQLKSMHQSLVLKISMNDSDWGMIIDKGLSHLVYIDRLHLYF